MNTSLIRNFSIIAHIDHGKSTLADRLLEQTKMVSERQKQDRLLDNMELEKERGITIKAQTVRLSYKARDGKTYFMNLIDTPGHVDFSYEVSRSLASCDGALLVVDASQGVEAQTLSNVYMALENDLEIIPVLNKIDLPHADVEKAKEEISEIVGLDADEAPLVSGKTGEGIEELIEEVIKKIPPPEGRPENPLQALIFDSWFDSYQGVIVLIRIVEGTLQVGDEIELKHVGEKYEVLKMAVNAPFFTEIKKACAGEVIMIICGIKTIRDVSIGDTIISSSKRDTPALKGFKECLPMVFCGIFPVDTSDYVNLQEALEKLALNDSSFTYEPESSSALGPGYRCGFLGLLHMNIIQERLEREYRLNLISTAPSCLYRVVKVSGEEMVVDNPALLPETTVIAEILEPYAEISIHVPNEFVGKIVKLCEERRGIQKEIRYITQDRVQIIYDLPFNEMVFDFYDNLKGQTRGYASMDYEMSDFRKGHLVKMDILVNSTAVDALSMITHRDSASKRGRKLVEKLRGVINRQQFDIPIQAAIGGKILARETVKALRKNVLAKCYGGDISRKRKLLEKQKEGKKRMKMVGNVEIPQEAFLSVLSVDE
ncbi:MAG: translation elongation factor 4 [Bacteriovoracales bacterium]|nr:translation elongation factor 4 [Bacteriovoracales bacterium]